MRLKPKKHSFRKAHSGSGKNISSEKPAPTSLVRHLWIFRICAAVLIPLFLLGGLEVALRIIGYGYPTRYFNVEKVNGESYYMANDRFGYRFFPASIARTPVPLQMPVEKPAGTYRIFVFGGSAAMGDPDPSYGDWRYLEVLLRNRYPGAKFEVICVAMTAINSNVVLPIARECAGLNGDLWVIYMGNNEMVGPFGGGTIFGLRAPGVDLIRADLAIKKTRVGQLLSALVGRLSRRSSAPGTWGGLEMFQGHELGYEDAERLRAYENFKKNLEDILEAGHKAGVPIILSTVGSNLKDCAPFASLHSAKLEERQKAQWEQECQEGMAMQNAGEYRSALEKYQGAEEIDPQYAEVYFRAGECQLGLTNDSEALREFKLARDYDALAFRADSRINGIIKAAAARYGGKGVYYLDGAGILGEDSPEKIPGNDVFYEHVHMNFRGNYLLGRGFAQAAAKLLPEWVIKRDKGQWETEAECEWQLGVSTWNRLQVCQEIMERQLGAPYTGQMSHEATMRLYKAKIDELKAQVKSEPPEQTRQLYNRALAAAPDDYQLYWNFAQYLAWKGDLAQATEELQRTKKLMPKMPGLYYTIGKLLIPQGKIDEAKENLLQALTIRSDYVPALNGLGQILENQQKERQAFVYFKRALRANPDEAETYINLGFWEQNSGNMSQAEAYYERAADLGPQAAADYFSRAIESAALGQHASAIELYNAAIQLNPEFWQAHYLLGGELAAQGETGEAAAEFAKAINYRPDFANSHLNLGVMLMKENRISQALAQFQITLEIDPSNSLAQQYIHMSEGKALENESR
jgi:tetratricopeptide (TPR) repeat protein